MLYKTMCLELLQQRPQLYEQLRRQRLLLPTLERLASALKASHAAWKEQLTQAQPGRDPSQSASAALELALKELEDSLPASPVDLEEAPSLDEAIRFLRRHTPPE